jgi:hypothetical protein
MALASLEVTDFVRQYLYGRASHASTNFGDLDFGRCLDFHFF